VRVIAIVRCRVRMAGAPRCARHRSMRRAGGRPLARGLIERRRWIILGRVRDCLILTGRNTLRSDRRTKFKDTFCGSVGPGKAPASKAAATGRGGCCAAIVRGWRERKSSPQPRTKTALLEVSPGFRGSRRLPGCSARRHFCGTRRAWRALAFGGLLRQPL
jgi:hypothetical protein